MKKIIVLLIVACMVTLLCACGNDKLGVTGNGGVGEEDACIHEWQSATCTKPKTCSKCGNIQGEELGHTTLTGVCSRCGENNSRWEISEFVDEFKRPTGKKYLSIIVDGTFSNTATTNSKLTAAIQVTNEDVMFMLWEYGSQVVDGIFDTNEYSITVLDDKDQKYYLDGVMYDGGTRIYLSNSDESLLLNLLKKSKQLSFYLKNSKYTVSTYLFTVETDGFSALYRQIAD